MVYYLIEFRFQSKRIRTYLKEMINEVNRKFHVGKRNHIPHISLVGPFTTTNEQRLLSDFGRICSETPLMKFKGKGFGTFDPNRVVFFKIIPDERFNEFRIRLSKTLKEYCKLPAHNKREDADRFGYHSTLAMNLNPNEFNSIKNHIKNKPAPDFTQIVMRVTLLRHGRILREYDFIQRKLLNRGQALNKHITRRSKTLLKEYRQGRYNPKTNIRITPIIRKKSLFNKILDWFK
jgi:hypothetical protein